MAPVRAPKMCSSSDVATLSAAGLDVTTESDITSLLIDEFQRNSELEDALLCATMDIVALRKLAESRAPGTVSWNRKPMTEETVARDLQWRWRRGHPVAAAVEEKEEATQPEAAAAEAPAEAATEEAAAEGAAAADAPADDATAAAAAAADEDAA